MADRSIRFVMFGADGRMGRRVVAKSVEDDGLELVGAVVGPHSPHLGDDAGEIAGVGSLGVAIGTAFPADGEVVIDFSTPEGASAAVAACRTHSVPLVMATTGLNEPTQAAIRQLAADVPVVWAPSMSTTVNLAMKLAQIAATALKDFPGGADVEILERHHRFKEDSPSGTALRFGEIIQSAMGLTTAAHGREGAVGARPRHEIGYHAIRTGDNPGEHTIVFGMLGETIELTVRASNRDTYALGALAAAKYVVRQAPGLYTMNDVLGL